MFTGVAGSGRVALRRRGAFHAEGRDSWRRMLPSLPSYRDIMCLGCEGPSIAEPCSVRVV